MRQRDSPAQYELSVRRGLAGGRLGGDTGRSIFGGKLATLAPPGVADLKMIRREKPRIPRSFLAALTATQRAKLKPYRVC